ncbi:MAG: glycosyltransferase family 4 protein, partial [Bacteroidia bacterium]|nr:glycosyltransferase family 4 protein [Bacteroidia bacterium]
IKLYRFLRKEKPLIVHTHTPKAGIIGMLASYLAGVKHRFHTVAGLPLLVVTGPKRKLLNLVEKATYFFATRVFPNSKGQYKLILEEKFAKPDKLEVIGQGSSNGIDVDHFDPDLIPHEKKEQLRRELGILENELAFVYIGRLVKDKGVNEMIAAFANFSATGNSAKLILVGSREDDLDPLLPTTEELIASHLQIVSVGWQNDIRPFLAIADVFVFPTYREGFPNVVLQSGAMGVPAIVTDINGCNEIITDSINGLIIPPKDSQAIIEAMRFMADHPAERRRMRAVARENIVQNYKHTYIWSELLKLYQQIAQPDDIP